MSTQYHWIYNAPAIVNDAGEVIDSWVGYDADELVAEHNANIANMQAEINGLGAKVERLQAVLEWHHTPMKDAKK